METKAMQFTFLIIALLLFVRCDGGSLEKGKSSLKSNKIALLKKEKSDSLIQWNARAAIKALKEDSVFVQNVCRSSDMVGKCAIVRDLRDSLNSIDKWYADAFECGLVGKPPVRSGWVDDGEISASILYYKNQIEKEGFTSKWDFNDKLYILTSK